MKSERTLLEKKADAYFILGTKVHITYINGSWKRGVIKDVKSDFFMLDELLEGMVPVFFVELESIEAMRPRKENDQ